MGNVVAAGFCPPEKISSMRDLANLNLNIAVGVLGGFIGTKEGGTATGSLREVRRVVVEGQKIGYEKEVLDYGTKESETDRLVREEKELLEKLKSVRERLNG